MKFIFALILVVTASISVQAKEATKVPAPETSKSCTDYAQYADTSMTEMKEIVKEKKATVIDVNSADSFKASAIPGSIHFEAHRKDLEKKLPNDKSALIVTYCGGKMCTAWQRAAKAACEMGYTNIRHFSDGITGWDKANKG